ncbi:MAG TPA: hypothetical protein VG297_10780 [Bryobacteraceae bacterium]|jgi:hypothetical protein|nr:hypothetical protein [Bryobacteraceae bacterium]
MRNLSSAGLLDLWDRGLTGSSGAELHPIDRGLLILAAAFSEIPFDTLADWALGRRNGSLAAWHVENFGPRLDAWIECPSCGEKLEFEVDARLLTGKGAEAATVIEHGGRSFRVPTSRDLARIAGEMDAAAAAMRLVEGCCLDADRAHASSESAWSEIDLEEVGEKMAAADPMAEVRLTFQCAACAKEWSEALDIAQFVWMELNAAATRLLHDVHTLASAYGWSEGDILAMSEARRARYVAMVLD